MSVDAPGSFAITMWSKTGYSVAGLLMGLFAAMTCRANNSPVVAKDRYLVKYADGLVLDYRTGLEWFAGPDRATSWNQARSWIAELKAKDTHWRMPTKSELDSLYHVGDGISNITPLLWNSGYWIWARDSGNAPAKWIFSFSYGGEGWSGRSPDDGGRVLTVRAGGSP